MVWTSSSQSFTLKKTAPGPRDRRCQIGARHAIFQGWTRPRLRSSRASRDGSLGRSSVRLSDGVTTFVERRRLRSAEFPVALLLQSQSRMDELQSDWLWPLYRNRVPWPHGGRARLNQYRIPIQKSPTVENQQRELEADYERLVRAFPVAGENHRPKTPCRPKKSGGRFGISISIAPIR